MYQIWIFFRILMLKMNAINVEVKDEIVCKHAHTVVLASLQTGSAYTSVNHYLNHVINRLCIIFEINY